MEDKKGKVVRDMIEHEKIKLTVSENRIKKADTELIKEYIVLGMLLICWTIMVGTVPIDGTFKFIILDFNKIIGVGIIALIYFTWRELKNRKLCQERDEIKAKIDKLYEKLFETGG